ncbi:C1 family peptidase, partial [Candidatus Marithioploca araucensis]|nr:C1 family peptidase [Candidatus Marithioploca araucensis]
YTLAYITPQNILYVMVAQDFTGTIELSYRVTDSKIFSDPATITIVVKTKEDTDFFFGSERVEAREFAQHSRRGFPGASLTSTSPSSVDLSSQFPTPGNQGKQGSCVAWSIAYAIKTYQEGIEENWSLDSQDHLFSPAFVYNQVISGANQGLKVSDVLDWVVTNGISTWATMPYDENDSTSQPSQAALQEAKYYPSDSWATVSSTDEMKTALVNGQPVIITFAVFNSLLNLKGDASVYHTADTFVDEHAATIVGYDDNHTSGGAFKVMNSWSTDWGDNGFFWLPYQFIPTRVIIDGEDTGDLISGAYVLVDKDNASLSSSVETSAALPPSRDDLLPNLLVADLQISYDNFKPKAQGELQYTIGNDGTVAVPANSMWVHLILSKNSSLKTDYHEDDYYLLIKDMVPFEL